MLLLKQHLDTQKPIQYGRSKNDQERWYQGIIFLVLGVYLGCNYLKNE